MISLTQLNQLKKQLSASNSSAVNNLRLPLPKLLLPVLLCSSPWALGQFSTFNGPGSWNDSASWNPTVVPDGSTYEVFLLDNSSITDLTTDVEVGTLETGGNASFVFGGNGSTITVHDALLHATGTLTLQANMGLILTETSTSSVLAGAPFALSNGAGIVNEGSINFGSGSSGALDFSPVTSGTVPTNGFRNDGIARFGTGAEATLASADIINTGRLTLATGGTGSFASTYTQNAASGERTTIVESSTRLHANTVTITSGVLYGEGLVNGSSTIFGNGDGLGGALISAGLAANDVGILSLGGGGSNPGEMGGSTWRFDLGGTAQGTEYDLINSDWQNFSVDGILLDVGLVNGFVPDALDTFTIVNNDGINGLFANALDSKINITGGGTFDVTVGSDIVILSNYVVPEPSSALLLLSGLGSLVCLRRRRVRRA